MRFKIVKSRVEFHRQVWDLEADSELDAMESACHETPDEDSVENAHEELISCEVQS